MVNIDSVPLKTCGLKLTIYQDKDKLEKIKDNSRDQEIIQSGNIVQRSNTMCANLEPGLSDDICVTVEDDKPVIDENVSGEKDFNDDPNSDLVGADNNMARLKEKVQPILESNEINVQHEEAKSVTDFGNDYSEERDNQNILEHAYDDQTPPAIKRIKSEFYRDLWKCMFCDFSTENQATIRKHTYKQHRFIYCEYCHQKFRKEERLLEHKTKKHTGISYFPCQQKGCELAFKTRIGLKRHQVNHCKKKVYTCETCGWSAKRKAGLKKHEAAKHVYVRKHECKLCDSSFIEKHELSVHMRRHGYNKMESCEICGFKVQTKWEVKSHMLTHSDDRPFKCTVPGCSKASKTNSDLQKHFRLHNSKRNVLCPICHKSYTSRRAVQAHTKIVHTPRTAVSCDTCGKVLKSSANLKKHMAIHAGILKFVCNICDKRFSVNTNLQKHLMTHDTSDRPYVCPICPYAARHQDHLLAHIGSEHGRDYAYFCELCRKPFQRYNQLKLHHNRMHTKEELAKMYEKDSIDLAVLKKESDGGGHGLGEGGVKKNESIKLDSKTDQRIVLNIDLKDNGKRVATLGFYDSFHIPLATRGFQFNYEKTGQKTDSWFMDPSLMDGKDRLKQEMHLQRKRKLPAESVNSGVSDINNKEQECKSEEAETDVIVNPKAIVMAQGRKYKYVPVIKVKKRKIKKPINSGTNIVSPVESVKNGTEQKCKPKKAKTVVDELGTSVNGVNIDEQKSRTFLEKPEASVNDLNNNEVKCESKKPKTVSNVKPLASAKRLNKEERKGKRKKGKSIPVNDPQASLDGGNKGKGKVKGKSKKAKTIKVVNPESMQ